MAKSRRMNIHAIVEDTDPIERIVNPISKEKREKDIPLPKKPVKQATTPNIQNRGVQSNTIAPKIKGLQQISITLQERQLDKLEDLEYQYRKKTGNKKAGRNEIVRALLDYVDIDKLLEIDPSLFV